MEQFRSDYLNQAWTSLALPDLFHFLPASFSLSIPQKWNYATYLVNSGYSMFLPDMNSNFKEAEALLQHRDHPLWSGVSQEAYNILITSKDQDTLVKKFIKGEVTLKALQPEAQLLLRAVTQLVEFKPLYALLKTQVIQQLDLIKWNYSQVFTYDKASKKLQHQPELALPKSSFVMLGSLKKEEKIVDKLFKLELALHKTSLTQKQHYEKGLRTLAVLIFIDETKPERVWDLFEALNKLPTKSELKKLMVAKQLRLVLMEHIPLNQRVLGRIKTQGRLSMSMSGTKLLDLVQEKIQEGTFRGRLNGSVSPKKKRRIEKSQPTSSTKTILEEIEDVKPVQVSTQNPTPVRAQKKKVLPSRSVLNTSMNSYFDVRTPGRKTNTLYKQILSPMRSLQKRRYHPDSVGGSFNLSNYSPVLNTSQKKGEEP